MPISLMIHTKVNVCLTSDPRLKRLCNSQTSYVTNNGICLLTSDPRLTNFAIQISLMIHTKTNVCLTSDPRLNKLCNAHASYVTYNDQCLFDQ